jgi:hypothetical protein
MREIRLSGLRKHIEGVRKDLDVKPEGIGRRQESSSEFSSRYSMANGLDASREFRVKTRSSLSIVEFGSMNGQMELAQALEAGQGHERMQLHGTVKEQLE